MKKELTLYLLFALPVAFVQAQSISEADEKAIMQQLRLMETRCKAKDMLGVAQIYLDNSYLISPNNVRTGREQIDKYWLAIKDPIDWKLTSTFLANNPKAFFESAAYKALRNKPPGWEKLSLDLKDVVYQLGVSELKTLWNGKESLSVVNFVLLWKKQPDGSFRILVDTYSGL